MSYPIHLGVQLPRIRSLPSLSPRLIGYQSDAKATSNPQISLIRHQLSPQCLLFLSGSGFTLNSLNSVVSTHSVLQSGAVAWPSVLQSFSDFEHIQTFHSTGGPDLGLSHHPVRTAPGRTPLAGIPHKQCCTLSGALRSEAQGPPAPLERCYP